MLPIVFLNLISLTMVFSASIRSAIIPPKRASANDSLALGVNAPGTTSLTTTNTSLLGDTLIDDRFKVSVYTGPERLNGTALLLSAIKVLVDLSFHDFNQAYSGGTYNYPEYNSVKVTFSDTTKKLTYRYAIWGLARAIMTMFETSGYYRRYFVLQWSENDQSNARVELGIISIIPVIESGIIGASNDTQNLRGSTSRSEAPLPRSDVGDFTRIAAPAPLGPPDPLQVFAEFYGSTLKLKEVFVPITLALLGIASRPTTDTVTDWAYKNRDTNSRFDWFIENPRTSPPFFERGYAARAIELIPELMFEKRTFSEVKFLVGYANVPLGVGYITKGDRRPIPPGKVETA